MQAPTRRSLRDTLAPATAVLRLTPLLFAARRDPELRPIMRSYLGWMPLCLFSQPFTWLRMLLASSRRFRRAQQRPQSFYVPHLNDAPFRPPDYVSKFLEANFAAISAEFARVAAEREVATPSMTLVSGGRWNTFPLVRSAKRIEENIASCPDTWTVAQACPLLPMRGAVYFSILYPGTHLRPHCGPSNLKVRYHLTIEDAGGVKIRSGDQWRTWRRGECLILDDSFEHEVLHAGDRRRVVLIVDCWNPELTVKERGFLADLHAVWRGR